MMNWKEIFDAIHYGELIGASEQQLLKLTENCSNKLNEGIKVKFPDSYLDFLRFCNTGINNEQRRIQKHI